MSDGSQKDPRHELLNILLGYLLSSIHDLAHLEKLLQETPPESPRQQVILAQMCSIFKGTTTADLMRGLKEPENYLNAAWTLAKLKNHGHGVHPTLSAAMAKLANRLFPSLEKDIEEERGAIEKAKRQGATRKGD